MKFGPGDQVDNVLILEPVYNVASGNAGWHGSPEGSASLSLYGVARRAPAHTVRYIQYQSTYPADGQIPRPTLGLPTTASINLVWMTSEDLSPFGGISSTRWGNEHFSTIGRLYQDYLRKDPDFVTGSYDYYSLFFQKDRFQVIMVPAGTPGPVGQLNAINTFACFTGSFTLEFWIKPFLTGTINKQFTLASVTSLFTLGITGSSGDLYFTNGTTTWTSSFGPQERRWSHVALIYDWPSRTGYFKVNLQDAGSFNMSPLSGTSEYTGSLCIGGIYDGSNGMLTQRLGANSVFEDPTFASDGMTSFHGMMGEVRGWGISRSVADLSGTWNTTVTGSALLSGSAFMCLRMVEGPLATFPQNIAAISEGSGCINYAQIVQPSASFNPYTHYAWMWNFNFLNAPVWLPNDNVNFYPVKEFVTVPASASWPATWIGNGTASYKPAHWLAGQSIDTVKRMQVIDIPQAFYGRQIVPGTLSITDRTYDNGSGSVFGACGLVRVINDDGRGGLYISGSMCSSSLANKEDYQGVTWNKVGNVFYGEGLVVIKDPTLLDMWRSDGLSTHPNDLLQLSFRGQSRLPVKTLMCRVDRGVLNATSNPTFWSEDQDDGQHVIRHASSSLYVTTIGVYNSQRELVGVARLADPVKIRGRDKFNFKLRMDF